MNPYNWRKHQPRVEISRPNLREVADELLSGGSGALLAGRGMGKSVFLRQLRRTLEQDADTRVVVISAPPPELTVRACLDQLAHHLEVPPGPSIARESSTPIAPATAPATMCPGVWSCCSTNSTATPSAGFVVQLAGAEIPDWAERYRRECLESLGLDAEVDEMTGSPIRARLAATSSVAGMTARVVHYLVTLPRRAG